MSLRRILLWTATFAACLATAAFLAPASVPRVGAPDATGAGAAAMRAAVDPETGELAVGAAALDGAAKADAELAAMLSKSEDGLTPVHHPDGRVSVRLDGRFMSASLARIGDDGRLETLCTESADEARAFLEGAPERDARGLEVR